MKNKKINEEQLANNLKKFSKKYQVLFSKQHAMQDAWDRMMSYDWNTFYKGMLDFSMLTVEDTLEEYEKENKKFSSTDGKLRFVVTPLAKIHMYIWYSILKKDSVFYNKHIVNDNRALILNNKAKPIWGTLKKIIQELESSEDLKLNGSEEESKLKSKDLNQFGAKANIKARGIRLDNSNRFIYLPDSFGRKITVISCMFHYDDLPKDKIIKSKSDKMDYDLQGNLWFAYQKLLRDLSIKEPITQIKPEQIKKIVKEDYFNKLVDDPDFV
jgi:hypothetical protein